MENKTTGIIATVVTALLCGCPGLFVLCFGASVAFIGATPDSYPDFTVDNPDMIIAVGAAILCLGVLFIAIPFVVGFFTLRSRPASPSDDIIDLDLDDQVPPAI